MSRLDDFVATFPWVHNNQIPFVKSDKPLHRCKVALVTTGGVYHATDMPFHIVTREDVDETYRQLPSVTTLNDLEIAHEHFNKSYARQDLNVIFPLERLMALATEGFIETVAPTAYSITGYIPRPQNLYDSGKQIAERMSLEDVDTALIVPV